LPALHPAYSTGTVPGDSEDPGHKDTVLYSITVLFSEEQDIAIRRCLDTVL